MSIATKTGDGGTAGLIGGKRLPKDHPLMECLGAIDEFNAFLGDAKAALPLAAKERETVAGIQKDLFTFSGILAGSGAQAPDENSLTQLIAELEARRGQAALFAVPGANPVSAKLHIARAVCRRAERRLVSLDRAGELSAGILPWFNRLSDLLFLLAVRFADAPESGAAPNE
jgi:cob(I)alamin adenosyltransferase